MRFPRDTHIRDILKKSFLLWIYSWRTLLLPEVRPHKRLALLKTALRAWLWRFGDEYRVEFAQGGGVFFAGHSLNADWNAFSDVFLERSYDTDYKDALVIDVGAHKGYFGAFALLQGAYRVFSLEPETTNYSFLKRAAATFAQLGHSWELLNVAAASIPGTVTLNVSGESWTHSLLPLPLHGKRSQVAQETVNALSLEDVVETSVIPNRRVILKIDVEGSECDIILATPTATWKKVHEVFVETHRCAPCRAEVITDYLHKANFDVIDWPADQVAYLRRA